MTFRLSITTNSTMTIFVWRRVLTRAIVYNLTRWSIDLFIFFIIFRSVYTTVRSICIFYYF